MTRDTTDVSTRAYEWLAWFEVHKKQVCGGGIALFLLICGGYVHVWLRAQTELKASAALLELRAIANPQEGRPTATAAEFLKVLREHSSTRAAQRALLLAAGTLFGENKHAEAQTQFERFLSQHGDGALAGIAALGVAACLDAQDKIEPALAAYQSVLVRYPTDAVVGRAKLAMAALYETKKQPDQALKLYEELGKGAALGGAGAEAMLLRQRLLQKHPNLAPTNAPAKAAAAALPLRPAAKAPSTPAPVLRTNAPAAVPPPKK